MRLAKVCFGFILLTCLQGQAHAQICSISHMPSYRQPVSYDLVNELLTGDRDIDFDVTFQNRFHQRAWVNTEFLNVRDAPSGGAINGMIFLGQPVEIFAKKGNWIAIRPAVPLKYTNQEYRRIMSRWVHKSYLSAYRPEQNISVKALKSKCSFEQMLQTKEQGKHFNECVAVRGFSMTNRLEGRQLIYERAYFEWAMSKGKLAEARKVFGGCVRVSK